MQPVSMIMSNMNVEAMTHHAPNALAAAQDTGQTQEIVQEGIRVVQRVQASDAAAEMQRVHRKTENDERECQRRGNSGDTFTHSEENENTPAQPQNDDPVLRENVRVKKRVSFIA